MSFAASLKALGWSQSAFARLMGRNPRSVRRWASGDLPAPTEAVALLALMIETDCRPDELEILLVEINGHNQ